MVDQYNNFNEIENQLKVLNLRRQVSIEELKLIKNSTANMSIGSFFNPSLLMQASKFGLGIALKKWVLSKLL